MANIIVLIFESAPTPKVAGLIPLLILSGVYPVMKTADYIKEQNRLKNGVSVTTTFEKREYKTDGYSDYSGNYYCYFKMVAKMPKEEVSPFYVHTLIWENNTCLGFFKTGFEGVESRIEKNKKNYDYEVKYFAPEKEYEFSVNISEHVYYDGTSVVSDAFVKVYNNGNKLKYESRIICMNYTDGTMAGNFFDYDNCHYDENGEKVKDFDY